MTNIKAMNKVSVAVNLADDLLSNGITSEPVSLSFIYGIGREGLSALECSLENGRVGEYVELTVKASDVAEAFAGIFPTVRGLINGKIMPESVTFDIEILKIEEVDNKEVVAALADSVSGCGSGGSCGCGC